MYTYTVVRRGIGPYNDAPYVLAYVELDEGPRMMTNIVDCHFGALKIGLPVEVTFQLAAEGAALPDSALLAEKHCELRSARVTINKVYPSAAAAVADIPDGARLGVGGFGPSRVYAALIPALLERGVKDLRIVANSVGGNPNSVWTLLETTGSATSPCPSPREPTTTSARARSASSWCRRARWPNGCAGGSGIAAFYTRTGVGTPVAEGKDVRWFDGVPYLLERSLTLDFAFIRAHRADRFGNMSFRGSGGTSTRPWPGRPRGRRRGEQVVDELDPDQVDLPGIFVNRVVEQAPVPARSRSPPGRRRHRPGRDLPRPARLDRREMAQVAAAMLPEPSYVNLGLGIPTLVSNFIKGRDIVAHAENGMLGVGEDATADGFDQDVYNAASYYVHREPGASFFDTLTSFEMVRGGRVNYVVLGALQVDELGNIANWATEGQARRDDRRRHGPGRGRCQRDGDDDATWPGTAGRNCAPVRPAADRPRLRRRGSHRPVRAPPQPGWPGRPLHAGPGCPRLQPGRGCEADSSCPSTGPAAARHEHHRRDRRVHLRHRLGVDPARGAGRRPPVDPGHDRRGPGRPGRGPCGLCAS